MSTRLSPDGRAVVEAVDRLTTQVKRLADAQSTPVAIIRDGVSTPVVGDPFPAGTCDASSLGVGNRHLGPCLLRPGHDGPVHRGPEGETWATVVATADDAPTTMADARTNLLPKWVVSGTRDLSIPEQTPDGDEDALRTARRDSLLVLLSRAGRMRLSTDEAALLRQHVETELRDRDQQYDRAERAVRRAADEYDRRQDAERERDAEQARLRDLLRSESQRANKAIDREATAEQAAEEARAELEQAQAAITRVRKLASRWAVLRAYGSAATELRRALDGTEQPTTDG